MRLSWLPKLDGRSDQSWGWSILATLVCCFFNTAWAGAAAWFCQGNKWALRDTPTALWLRRSVGGLWDQHWLDFAVFWAGGLGGYLLGDFCHRWRLRTVMRPRNPVSWNWLGSGNQGGRREWSRWLFIRDLAMIFWIGRRPVGLEPRSHPNTGVRWASARKNPWADHFPQCAGRYAGMSDPLMNLCWQRCNLHRGH